MCSSMKAIVVKVRIASLENNIVKGPICPHSIHTVLYAPSPICLFK